MRISLAVPLLGAILTIAVLTTSAPARASSFAPGAVHINADSPTAPAPQPISVQERQLGTVITKAKMLLDPALAAVATGKRISYVSSDPDGQHIVVTGAILTPRKQTRPKQDIIAWAHGTEGLADGCAPSRFATLSSDPTFPLYATTVKSFLDQGWTVAATDYAGLGSPGPHPYLIGNSEGRAIIDSVRAARQLDQSLSNDWVAIGHSQGGQGALFAGEQAHEYRRGLQLRGVVGMAAAADLDQLAEAIVGTPGQGYLVMALSGLAAVDPSVHPEQLLAPPALIRVDGPEDGMLPGHHRRVCRPRSGRTPRRRRAATTDRREVCDQQPRPTPQRCPSPPPARRSRRNRTLIRRRRSAERVLRHRDLSIDPEVSRHHPRLNPH